MEMVLNAFILWATVALVTGGGRKERDHSRRSTLSNQCSIFHNGCTYDLVLTNAQCMNDKVDILDRLYRDMPAPMESNVIDNMVDEVDIVPASRMDRLERKLTKMMEGLSIRSLRHIRQIKADLRGMTDTINSLRKGGPKNEAPMECPPEFISIGTWPSCYRFSTFNATWHQAREYCSAVGANLVTMDTLKEAYILDYLIKSHPGKLISS